MNFCDDHHSSVFVISTKKLKPTADDMAPNPPYMPRAYNPIFLYGVIAGVFFVFTVNFSVDGLSSASSTIIYRAMPRFRIAPQRQRQRQVPPAMALADGDVISMYQAVRGITHVYC